MFYENDKVLNLGSFIYLNLGQGLINKTLFSLNKRKQLIFNYL